MPDVNHPDYQPAVSALQADQARLAQLNNQATEVATQIDIVEANITKHEALIAWLESEYGADEGG